MSLLGIAAFLFLAWIMGPRKKPPARLLAWGLGLQFILAILVLKTPLGRAFFDMMGRGVNKILDYSQSGSRFVFGNLADASIQTWGFIFAFQVFPIIIFVGALVAVLYHLRVLPWVVGVLARLLRTSLGISGAEALSVASNIFLGMTESVLAINPYVARLTSSELFCITAAGMANIAGSVLVAYVGILQGLVPDIAGHLLAASIMTAPSAILISKLMVPETGRPQTSGKGAAELKNVDSNLIEAAARGALEGLQLCLNIGAVIIAFLAMVALLNGILSAAGLSLEQVFGWAFSPFAFLMGVPAQDCLAVGGLLGKKVVLNEFIAYLDLAKLAPSLAPRSALIASYALCGFANFGSVGIMIGSLPSKRSEIARIGLKTILAGSLATFTTACIAGILL